MLDRVTVEVANCVEQARHMAHCEHSDKRFDSIKIGNYWMVELLQLVK
jgi:hypothetical protein